MWVMRPGLAGSEHEGLALVSVAAIAMPNIRLTRPGADVAHQLEEAAMLSDNSRSVIEATLPVVDEHIQEIADVFYLSLIHISEPTRPY